MGVYFPFSDQILSTVVVVSVKLLFLCDVFVGVSDSIESHFLAGKRRSIVADGDVIQHGDFPP